MTNLILKGEFHSQSLLKEGYGLNKILIFRTFYVKFTYPPGLLSLGTLISYPRINCMLRELIASEVCGWCA